MVPAPESVLAASAAASGPGLFGGFGIGRSLGGCGCGIGSGVILQTPVSGAIVAVYTAAAAFTRVETRIATDLEAGTVRVGLRVLVSLGGRDLNDLGPVLREQTGTSLGADCCRPCRHLLTGAVGPCGTNRRAATATVAGGGATLRRGRLIQAPITAVVAHSGTPVHAAIATDVDPENISGVVAVLAVEEHFTVFPEAIALKAGGLKELDCVVTLAAGQAVVLVGRNRAQHEVAVGDLRRGGPVEVLDQLGLRSLKRAVPACSLCRVSSTWSIRTSFGPSRQLPAVRRVP